MEWDKIIVSRIREQIRHHAMTNAISFAAVLLAEELDSALRVISAFDEGPDLVLYYKQLMVLEGNPEYELHFNTTDRLSPSQHEFLHQQWLLFKSWWSQWPGVNSH